MSEQARRAVKPKILCVDDEHEITDSLARLLRSDFDVQVANSFKDAVGLLTDDLAIVLSDQRMPDGSGLDVLAKAKEKAPLAVRALLTGQVEFEDLVDAINRQLVHKILLKPWENEYLKVQMFEALSAHELLALALTDPVTHLKNHRYFQDQLKIEIARAERHSRQISLLMIDIDDFKKYNDTHGHPAGDRALQESARKLLQAVRTIDAVARYGGEEFAVIMPDTSVEQATLVAERIRESFANDSTFVTVSIGIATFPVHASTSATLVDVADKALYRAKSQGRNQSIVGIPLRP